MATTQIGSQVEEPVWDELKTTAAESHRSVSGMLTEAIHERLIETFGGPRGVRDPGLLESALFRPRTGYYGDLTEMAAALFESILLNRPFVDGNKRVAFFATDVFLRLNGHQLAVRPEAARRFLIGLLESGECDFARLLPWVRRSIRPLPRRRGQGTGAPESERDLR